MDTLKAGIEQYHLITAQRDVLEKTLGQAVKLMSDMLILANPAAYGRAIRIRRIVHQIILVMDLTNGWQFEVAATLSQIGCVALPRQLLQKVDQTYRERRPPALCHSPAQMPSDNLCRPLSSAP